MTQVDVHGLAPGASTDASQNGRVLGLGSRGLPQRYWRDVTRRRLLAGADLASVVASAAVLVLTHGARRDALILACSAPAWIFAAKLFMLYDRDHRTLRHLTVDELPWIAFWSLAGMAILTVVLDPFPSLAFQERDLPRAWLALVFFGFLFRSIARQIWRSLAPRERVLLVGDGPLADALVRKLELFGDIHVSISSRLPSLESLQDALQSISDIDRLIVACDDLSEELVGRLLQHCRRIGAKLTVVPPGRGMLGSATLLGHIADLPLLDYNTSDISRTTVLIKRATDLGLATIGFVVLLPVQIAIALAIVLDDGFPVFFRQRRAGRLGAPFSMIKFRTMVRGAEAMLPDLVPFAELNEPMFKLRRDPRVTRVGRFLRRTSLDELPQLWNVLRGDMAVVGPRPEQLDLVQRYAAEHMFRLSVKPGITGPMQVYGRGELSFSERLAVEREYIENLSVIRDARILLMTLPAVLARRGAY